MRRKEDDFDEEVKISVQRSRHYLKHYILYTSAEEAAWATALAAVVAGQRVKAKKKKKKKRKSTSQSDPPTQKVHWSSTFVH